MVKELKKSSTVESFELLKKMAGISNFQMEEAFEKIGDEDLLENFVGVFPSNRMNRFINHAAMISECGEYPFVIANTDADNKPGVHWGVYLTLNLEMISFSLILLI